MGNIILNKIYFNGKENYTPGRFTIRKKCIQTIYLYKCFEYGKKINKR